MVTAVPGWGGSIFVLRAGGDLRWMPVECLKNRLLCFYCRQLTIISPHETANILRN